MWGARSTQDGAGGDFEEQIEERTGTCHAREDPVCRHV